MSHHVDTEAAQKDGRLDLCDLYVFDGATPATTVFILTVNPLAGQLSPTTFHPEAEYAFHIATAANYSADIVYRFTFGEPDSSGVQTWQLNRLGGNNQAGHQPATGQTEKTSEIDGGGRVWAGLRADPFYGNGAGLEKFMRAIFEQNRFDPTAFANATNSFEQGNVSAIVLELPNSLLAAEQLQVWATTTLVQHGQRVQINRAANPLMLHLFLPDPQLKDAHNQGQPKDDVARTNAALTGWVAQVTELAGTAENPLAYGQALAATLLPDVQSYRVGTAASYSFTNRNGRRPLDNGMDVVLTLLVNQPLSAQVKPAVGSYQPSFPYLGQPR